MGVVISITGPTGSGKSTIARHLSEKFGLPHFSLGQFQREHFASLGYKSPREYHKKLGLGKTYFGLWPAFLKEIKDRASSSGIVIESVYTPELYDKIVAVFPHHRHLLLNITANRHLRLKRFQTREELPVREAKREFQALERSKRAAGFLGLLKRKGIVIHNRSHLEQFLTEVESEVARRIN